MYHIEPPASLLIVCLGSDDLQIDPVFIKLAFLNWDGGTLCPKVSWYAGFPALTWLLGWSSCWLYVAHRTPGDEAQQVVNRLVLV